jgi:hypothetical protein
LYPAVPSVTSTSRPPGLLSSSGSAWWLVLGVDALSYSERRSRVLRPLQ